MRWPILLFMSIALPAQAGDRLAEAQKLLKGMDYNKAQKTAEKVLQDPGSMPADLVGAYRIQGLSLSALNKPSESLEAFRRLLAIDPKFRLSKKVSPKLRDPFYKAAGMALDSQPISIAHTKPECTGQLGGMRLKARLESNPLGLVHGIRFRYQVDQSAKVKELAVLVKEPKTISFKLPDGFKARKFYYWVEAFNAHGGVLASQGSQKKPFMLKAKEAPPTVVAKVDLTPPPASEVNPPPAEQPPPDEVNGSGTPWFKTWWFWTAVGVVAVGAVTGGVLASQPEDKADPLHWNVSVQ